MNFAYSRQGLEPEKHIKHSGSSGNFFDSYITKIMDRRKSVEHIKEDLISEISWERDSVKDEHTSSSVDSFSTLSEDKMKLVDQLQAIEEVGTDHTTSSNGSFKIRNDTPLCEAGDIIPFDGKVRNEKLMQSLNTNEMKAKINYKKVHKVLSVLSKQMCGNIDENNIHVNQITTKVRKFLYDAHADDSIHPNKRTQSAPNLVPLPEIALTLAHCLKEDTLKNDGYNKDMTDSNDRYTPVLTQSENQIRIVIDKSILTNSVDPIINNNDTFITAEMANEFFLRAIEDFEKSLLEAKILTDNDTKGDTIKPGLVIDETSEISVPIPVTIKEIKQKKLMLEPNYQPPIAEQITPVLEPIPHEIHYSFEKIASEEKIPEILPEEPKYEEKRPIFSPTTEKRFSKNEDTIAKTNIIKEISIQEDPITNTNNKIKENPIYEDSIIKTNKNKENPTHEETVPKVSNKSKENLIIKLKNNQQKDEIVAEIPKGKALGNIHQKLVQQIEATDSLREFQRQMNRNPKRLVITAEELYVPGRNLNRISSKETPIVPPGNTEKPVKVKGKKGKGGGDNKNTPSMNKKTNKTAAKPLNPPATPKNSKYGNSLWFSNTSMKKNNAFDKNQKTVIEESKRSLKATQKVSQTSNSDVYRILHRTNMPYMKTTKEIKSPKLLNCFDVLDELTSKDVRPMKAEYPRKDYVRPTHCEHVENMYLYKLVFNPLLNDHMTEILGPAPGIECTFPECPKCRTPPNSKNKHKEDKGKGKRITQKTVKKVKSKLSAKGAHRKSIPVNEKKFEMTDKQAAEKLKPYLKDPQLRYPTTITVMPVRVTYNSPPPVNLPVQQVPPTPPPPATQSSKPSTPNPKQTESSKPILSVSTSENSQKPRSYAMSTSPYFYTTMHSPTSSGHQELDQMGNGDANIPKQIPQKKNTFDLKTTSVSVNEKKSTNPKYEKSTAQHLISFIEKQNPVNEFRQNPPQYYSPFQNPYPNTERLSRNKPNRAPTPKSPPKPVKTNKAPAVNKNQNQNQQVVNYQPPKSPSTRTQSLTRNFNNRATESRRLLKDIQTLAKKNKNLLETNIQKVIETIEVKIVDVLSNPSKHGPNAFNRVETEILDVLNMMRHMETSKATSTILKNIPEKDVLNVEYKKSNMLISKLQSIGDSDGDNDAIQSEDTSKEKTTSSKTNGDQDRSSLQDITESDNLLPLSQSDVIEVDNVDSTEEKCIITSACSPDITIEEKFEPLKQKRIRSEETYKHTHYTSNDDTFEDFKQVVSVKSDDFLTPFMYAIKHRKSGSPQRKLSQTDTSYHQIIKFLDTLNDLSQDYKIKRVYYKPVVYQARTIQIPVVYYPIKYVYTVSYAFIKRRSKPEQKTHHTICGSYANNIQNLIEIWRRERNNLPPSDSKMLVVQKKLEPSYNLDELTKCGNIKKISNVLCYRILMGEICEEKEFSPQNKKQLLSSLRWKTRTNKKKLEKCFALKTTATNQVDIYRIRDQRHFYLLNLLYTVIFSVMYFAISLSYSCQ